MFLVIRDEREGVKDIMCFVKAQTIQQAKTMTSVPTDSTQWVEIPDHLLRTIIDIKEGYIALEIEPV